MNIWKKLTPTSSSAKFKICEEFPLFSTANIRFVVFTYQCKMGRQCLFDSMAETGKIDKEKIDEIVFGSLSMRHHTNVLKIHHFKNKKIILISKIYISSAFHDMYNSHDTLLDLYAFDELPPVDLRKEFASLPIADVLYSSLNNYSTTCKADETDENILSSSAGSIYQISSRSKHSNLRKKCVPKICLPDQNLSNSKGEKQLAFVLLFHVPPRNSRVFKDFIITHSTLIEKEIDLLNEYYTKANYFDGCNVPAKANISFHELLERLNLLLKPCSISTWHLLLSNPSSTRIKIASILFHDFRDNLQHICGRSSKFFLGSFLTSVLTHHLTWTTTLSNSNKNMSGKPILNQMHEIYGAIGRPITACHVIISCGCRRRRYLVEPLLRFISLFIRFSVLSNRFDSSLSKKLSMLSTGSCETIWSGKDAVQVDSKCGQVKNAVAVSSKSRSSYRCSKMDSKSEQCKLIGSGVDDKTIAEFNDCVLQVPNGVESSCPQLVQSGVDSPDFLLVPGEVNSPYSILVPSVANSPGSKNFLNVLGPSCATVKRDEWNINSRNNQAINFTKTIDRISGAYGHDITYDQNITYDHNITCVQNITCEQNESFTQELMKQAKIDPSLTNYKVYLLMNNSKDNLLIDNHQDNLSKEETSVVSSMDNSLCTMNNLISTLCDASKSNIYPCINFLERSCEHLLNNHNISNCNSTDIDKQLVIDCYQSAVRPSLRFIDVKNCKRQRDREYEGRSICKESESIYYSPSMPCSNGFVPTNQDLTNFMCLKVNSLDSVKHTEQLFKIKDFQNRIPVETVGLCGSEVKESYTDIEPKFKILPFDLCDRKPVEHEQLCKSELSNILPASRNENLTEDIKIYNSSLVKNVNFDEWLSLNAVKNANLYNIKNENLAKDLTYNSVKIDNLDDIHTSTKNLLKDCASNIGKNSNLHNEDFSNKKIEYSTYESISLNPNSNNHLSKTNGINFDLNEQMLNDFNDIINYDYKEDLLDYAVGAAKYNDLANLREENIKKNYSIDVVNLNADGLNEFNKENTNKFSSTCDTDLSVFNNCRFNDETLSEHLSNLNDENIDKFVNINKYPSTDDDNLNEFKYCRLFSEVRNSPKLRSCDESFVNIPTHLLRGISKSCDLNAIIQVTVDKSFTKNPANYIKDLLHNSIVNPLIGRSLEASICLLADIDNWCVQIYRMKCKRSLETSKNIEPQICIPSQLILTLLESLVDICQANLPPELWLSHMETGLENILLKSQILAEFIKKHGSLCSKETAHLLGFEINDLPLLLAVASTHSPAVTKMLTKL